MDAKHNSMALLIYTLFTYLIVIKIWLWDHDMIKAYYGVIWSDVKWHGTSRPNMVCDIFQDNMTWHKWYKQYDYYIKKYIYIYIN